MSEFPHPESFVAGCVYFVKDSQVRLPDGSRREAHDERRPVIVVSDKTGRHDLNNASTVVWPSVLVVPISSKTKNRTRFDVKIAAAEGGLKKKGWARIPGLQLVDKDWLEDMTGCVDPDTLEAVYAQILNYLGLVE